jgi:anti-sigma B factor antagonist
VDRQWWTEPLEMVLTQHAITATDGLEITVKHGDQRIVVYLRGHLSIDSSPDLRDQLLAILRDQPPKSLIVDLTQISYIDASGIATLLEALKIARNRQTALCLQGLQGPVVHLFQVTGLLALFEANGYGNASLESKVC